MPTVDLYCDERYPTYWIYDDQKVPFGQRVEISEEDIIQYKFVEAAYNKWQDKFNELYKAAM